MSAAVDLDTYWRELVTGALLGTDRRPPPVPPAGPIADLVDDAVLADDAARALAGVAATAAARRAAFVSGPPAPSLQAPPADDRPWCSAAAVDTWREVTREWPVLEDEWMLTLIERGDRLPPDAIVEMLIRHRSDAVRRARVMLAAGPIAAWVTDHVPRLEAATARSVTAEAVTSLPELPMPPDLAELLGLDAHSFCRRLVPTFGAGGFGASHKAVLVNLIARCRPAVLLDAAEAMAATRVGLALALADEAGLRHRMLVELGVAP